MPRTKTSSGTVVIDVTDSNKVYHFWNHERAVIPSGTVSSCTSRARVKLTGAVILQIGMDYWRTKTAQYAGADVNNQESGEAAWLFPSSEWQDAVYNESYP